MRIFISLVLLALGLSSVSSASAACSIQITNAGPCSLDGKTYGTPKVGEDYGIKVTFNVVGTPTKPFRIKFQLANQTHSLDPYNYYNGNNWSKYWRWSLPIADEIPWSVTIDEEGVSGNTNPSNSISGTFVPVPPSTAIELYEPKTLKATESSTFSVNPASGGAATLSILYGLPSTHGAQTFLSGTAPVGSTIVNTQPYNIPVYEVRRNNLTTETYTDTKSFYVTAAKTRSNPALLKKVTWADLEGESAAWKQWLEPDDVNQSTNPAIADFVSSNLPADFRQTLSPYEAARRLHCAVARTLTYKYPPDHYDAVNVLQDKSGDCGGYSALLTASLRSIGIPTRRTGGFRVGETVWHCRTEFHLPGCDWIPADATDSNAKDPTGTYAYEFGTLYNSDAFVSVAVGDKYKTSQVSDREVNFVLESIGFNAWSNFTWNVRPSHSSSLSPVSSAAIAVQQTSNSFVEPGRGVDFGTANGTTKTIPLKIFNSGTSTLTLSSIQIDGTNASDFQKTQPSATSLAPGASTSLSVNFTPMAEGSRSARLVVASNDPVTPTFTVNLTGANVLPPVLHVPSDLNIAATDSTGAVVTFDPATFTGGGVTSPTISYSKSSGSVFPIGRTVVSVSAVANNQQIASGTFAVTVSDTTPPILSLPANVTVSSSNANGAVVNFDAATAADNVTASPTITYSKASGTLFPIGSTTVTVTATDSAGNASSGTFSVTVPDTTAPVLTLPSNVTVNATSSSGAVVNYGVATATDNAAVSPTITHSKASGTIFPIGVTPVTVTATDVAGNVSSGTFTVTVSDLTAPVLSLPSNLSVQATSPSGAVVNYGAATATDNVTTIPVITYSKASGTLFPIGSTTVTVTASDAVNNVSTGTFTVNVAEIAAPVFTGIPNNKIVEAKGASGSVVNFNLPTASDTTGNVPVTSSATSGTMFPIGTTTVTFTANNPATQKTSTASFTVTVVDTTAPILSGVSANLTVSATSSAGAVVTYSPATATDVVTTSPSITYSKASGTMFPIGVTTVTVTAKDAANNTSVATFTVSVTDTQKPVMQSAVSKLVLNTDASGKAVLPDYTKQMTVTDNVGVIAIEQTPPAGTLLSGGTVVVSWSAHDAAGNVATSESTVEVRESPRIVTQPKPIQVRANANVSFAVEAEGYGELSYQWKRNGVEVSGGTQATLNLKGVQLAQTGTYNVAVTNSIGTVVSAPVTLSFVNSKSVVGDYQALLKHDNSSAQSEVAIPGRLSVTVTTTTSFSARLEYFGETYTLIGAFTPELTFAKTIARKGRSSLLLALELDPLEGELRATVTDSVSAFTSVGTLVLQPLYTVKNPAPQTGVYTVVLDPRKTLGTGPVVGGVASVNVSALGTVTLAGALPDGTTLSSNARLQSDGSVGVYDGLYSEVFPTAGYIAGTLTFDPKGGESAVVGGVEWNKPKQARGLWAAGFTQTLGVSGSVYKVPGAKELALATPSLSFSATDSAAIPVTLKTGNMFFVTPNKTSTLVLSLNKSTGVVTGSLTDLNTKKKRTLTGVVLQATGEVSGFYPKDTDAGEWSLSVPTP